MAFRITTLMENQALTDCLTQEHGLSLLVEGENCRILYDTGASPMFLKNAAELGEVLEPLDALVLSHGHYDHTGGVAALLTGRSRPASVYLGRNFFGPRYSRKKDGLKEIGAAFEPEAVSGAGIPCVEVGDEPIALAAGVWAVSGFASTEELEGPSPAMMRGADGALEEDRFEDEVVLVLETEGELVLVSGCAHVGILSMCRRVEALFGRPVTSFVGGTHLMAADDQRIEHTCRCLRERGMVRLGACHCNGPRAAAYFKENFDGFFENHVGTRVDVI